jgi:hypothetical protein
MRETEEEKMRGVAADGDWRRRHKPAEGAGLGLLRLRTRED